MYRSKRISLCLPCRNEAANLKTVVASLPTFIDEVIVISNGSTDDTARIAKALGIQIIEDNRHIDGIGYGYAHMTGIKQASGDIIVGADCDGTYPLHQLATIIDHLIDNQLNFVSCSRLPAPTDSHMPLAIKAGVMALNAEVGLLYGVKINDILSGMWLFDARIKDQLSLTMGDWNLSPQIKLNAAIDPRIAFAEYPIVQARRGGRSHQNYLKTGWSHAKWIAANRWGLKTQPAPSVLVETD